MQTNSHKESRGRKKHSPSVKKHVIQVSLPPDQYKRLYSLSHLLKIPAPSILSNLSYGIICSLHEVASTVNFSAPEARTGREAYMNHLVALVFKAHQHIEELEAELFPGSSLLITRGFDE